MLWKKGKRSLQPLWGARDFSFPSGQLMRGGCAGERWSVVSLSPFSPDLPVPARLSGRFTNHPERLPASQLGSHRAKPASQSGVRISLRGSNVSAEGLLDGSSSDNSQVRRACCYILECEKERAREKEGGKEGRREEKREKKSFGLGRMHAPL